MIMIIINILVVFVFGVFYMLICEFMCLNVFMIEFVFEIFCGLLFLFFDFVNFMECEWMLLWYILVDEFCNVCMVRLYIKVMKYRGKVYWERNKKIVYVWWYVNFG